MPILRAILCDVSLSRPRVESSGLTVERDLARALLEALRWKRDHPEAIYGLDNTPDFNPMMRMAEIAQLEEQYMRN